MCVKIFHFNCVYIGQPVSDISEFLTAYIRKCTVETIISYNASYYVEVNSQKLSDNSNNVHFSGPSFFCSPYLAIKSALASIRLIMARRGRQMNLKTSK